MKALASQVTEEHYAKGMIYPPIVDIKKSSAHIVASIAAKAYELGECVSIPPFCVFSFTFFLILF